MAEGEFHVSGLKHVCDQAGLVSGIWFPCDLQTQLLPAGDSVSLDKGVGLNAQPGGAALLVESGLGAKSEPGRGAPRRHREDVGSFAGTECCA